jgi:hypothetical protein
LLRLRLHEILSEIELIWMIGWNRDWKKVGWLDE